MSYIVLRSNVYWNNLNKSLTWASFSREGEKEGMMAFIIVLLMVILLDIAAMRWGADSTDGINSLEWLRRQQWYGFH